MRIFLLIVFTCFFACNNAERPLPKPHQYPRVDFPQKKYNDFSDIECDVRFKIPAYSLVEKKTAFFDEKPLHPCWFDVTFPAFNGRLHCSYFDVTNREVFDELVDDVFDLVSKHRSKASFARESIIEKEDVNGILFDIDGPVASPYLFYLTDSTSHFFMGSMYFKNKVNPDSMQIIHDFVREDVVTLLESFEWVD